MVGAMVPRHLVRLVLAVAVAVAGLLALAPPCLACSCVPTTPREALAGADAAFVGTVVRDVMDADGTTQTFEVEQVFKGRLGPTVDVWAQIGTEVVNSCAVLYPTGDRVAVLLVRDGDGRWTSRACSFVTVAELHRVGGTPVAPGPGPSVGAAPPATGSLVTPEESGGLPTWAVVALGAILAVVAVGGQVAWAGRRDRRARYPSGWDPVDVEEPRRAEP